MVLPTGGAIEYDHGAGVTRDDNKGAFESGQLLSPLPWELHAEPTPGWRPVIYRRLLSRRVYADASSGSPLATTSYPLSETVDSFTTHSPGVFNGLGVIRDDEYVAVENSASGGSVASTTWHYFDSRDPGIWGINDPDLGPAANLLYGQTNEEGMGDPFEGREFQSESPNLQLVTRIWGRPNPSHPNNLKVCQENTTLVDTSQTSGKIFLYGGGFENLTDVYEYDYGSAPLIDTGTYSGCPSSAPGGFTYTRHAKTEYKTGSSYTGTGTGDAYLRSLPSRKLVCGSGTCDANNFVSKTEFEYDETGPTSRASATGHDTDNYGTGRTNRGNLTSEKVWLNTSSSWLTSTRTYDILGNVTAVSDPRTYQTTFSYTDQFTIGNAPDNEPDVCLRHTAASKALDENTNFVHQHPLRLLHWTADPR